MKTNNKSLLNAIMLIGLTFIASNTVSAQGISRTELSRHDLGIAGYEEIQLIVAFEPGTAFGMHKHPGEEIIYVTEGVIEYEVEGQPTVILKAGEVLFVPAGTNHAAKNKGNVTAAELGTFIVEKGKPLVTMKK
jgi:quercetin dioxygenase-like cupin family protein